MSTVQRSKSATASAGTDDACAIRLEHIVTRLKGRTIHENVNLCVRQGEILGLVGASGSGKTTLLREIIGLESPNEGRITIAGEPLQALDAMSERRLRESCGVVFQGGALFSSLSVFDNVAMPLRELKLLEEPLVSQLVCQKLRSVGLQPDAAHLMPAQLSGGMVKRAALARALALEPELLLLDEPTSGLDPISGSRFIELISRLHRELRFTALIVTHDLDVLRHLCDRVAVLADRRLVAVGPLKQVVTVEHRFVREFFNGLRVAYSADAGI